MQRVKSAFDPRRVSALYIGLAVFAAFAIWIPALFLTEETFRSTLSAMAIPGILAVGLVLPLAAGVYDLSIGWVLGLSSAVIAVLTLQGMNPVEAGMISMAASLCVGVANAIVIVGLKVDSFIATLATGSIVEGIIVLIEHSQQQFGLPHSVSAIAGNGPLRISYVFYALLALSVVVWFYLEHTPAGRWTRATGGNREAAKLAGVWTSKMIVVSLLTSSLVGGIAGIFYSATINGASPQVGGTYLLPAFAAALFGATQVRPGHPNVWGTMLAQFVLALGAKGFNLVGVDFWIQDVFFGAALIVAVTIRYFEKRAGAAVHEEQEPNTTSSGLVVSNDSANIRAEGVTGRVASVSPLNGRRDTSDIGL